MVCRADGITGNALHLTDDEVYTLQILLGFVASDRECNSIANKLIDIAGDVAGEDYSRAQFEVVEEGGTGRAVQVPVDATVVIRFI